MAKPNEEQADQSGPSLESIVGVTGGPPPFLDSFLERRNRLYRQRSDYMDRVVRIQRDIMAIECILGS